MSVGQVINHVSNLDMKNKTCEYFQQSNL